jgi:type VI secretion system protein ImpH
MATAIGRTDPSITDLVLKEGYCFRFFQAVRLLHWIYPQGRTFSRWGAPSPPGKEVVRFHSRTALSFAPSEVASVRAADGGPAHLTVAFMGLAGNAGVLPMFYNEYVIQRLEAKDPALAAFLDIFNHRFLSLFYLAWEKHHPWADPRNAITGGQLKFRQYLFDLIGMGTGGLRNRLRHPDSALLQYAGLLAQRPRSAAALEGILRDYFGLPIAVRQFQGRWVSLAEEHRSYLHTEGAHNKLGEGTIAGDALWVTQTGFRIRVGPLSWRRFRSFLAGQPALKRLCDLARFFVDGKLTFDVQLVLAANEVPRCRLGGDEPQTASLGVAAWLITDRTTWDRDDTVLAGF